MLLLWDVCGWREKDRAIGIVSVEGTCKKVVPWSCSELDHGQPAGAIASGS